MRKRACLAAILALVPAALSPEARASQAVQAGRAWVSGFASVTMAAPAASRVGDTVAFAVGAASGSGLLRYSWDFGDGSPSTPFAEATGAAHVYAAPQHYTVTVTQQDEAGGLATSTAVQIIYAPAADPLPANSSPIACNPGNGLVYSVNPDGATVTAIDPATARKVAEIPVGEGPEALSPGPGNLIWVANRRSSTVSVIDGSNNTVTATITLPRASQPFGIAASQDGKSVYVALLALGKLARIDPATRSLSGPLADAGPQPRGLAVSGNGKRIFATRFISPDGGGEVREFNAATLAVTRTFVLPVDGKTADTELSGRGLPNYLTAITLSPDGSTAWIPSKKDNILRGLARDGLPMNDENTVRTMVSQIHLSDNSLGNAIDLNDREMANAVAFSPRGDLAFVATQGTNTVEVFDAYDPLNRLVVALHTDLAPQGLAITPDGARLVVHNFMARTLQVFDISGIVSFTTNAAVLIGTIPAMDREPLPAQVLAGKRIFYNADSRSMNEHGYVTCASCHLDGGTDGRVWDFTDRGEGLRRTITLQGHGGTVLGPLHWSANFNEIQDFENDMRGPQSGRGFMQDADFLAGTTRDPLGDDKAGKSADLDALAAYVSSLDRFPASPYRNADGGMTKDALAGKGIFARPEVGCAQCHTGPNFSDSRIPAARDRPDPAALDSNGYLRVTPNTVLSREGFILHDVGTLRAGSGSRRHGLLPGLDTPTLNGIWLTAPYLHDGSQATLIDVLTKGNLGDKHGHTSQLSATELRQLEAYLLQLDGNPPEAARVAAPPRSALPRGLRMARLGNALEFRCEPIPGNLGVSPILAIFSPDGRVLARLQTVPYAAGNAPGLRWIWKDGAGRQSAVFPVLESARENH